jgi:hypothetical protein
MFSHIFCEPCSLFLSQFFCIYFHIKINFAQRFVVNFRSSQVHSSVAELWVCRNFRLDNNGLELGIMRERAASYAFHTL